MPGRKIHLSIDSLEAIPPGRGEEEGNALVNRGEAVLAHVSLDGKRGVGVEHVA